MKEKATMMMNNTRALRRFFSTYLPISILLVGCSSSNPIVSNYYDDGIYHDSEYGGSYVAEELGLTENSSQSPVATTSPDGYDYYDPTHVSPPNNSTTSSNWNFYGSMGYGFSPFMQPGMTFGMGMNYGMMNPWYNPYMNFYDPFYPNFGWGQPGFGYPGFGYPGFGYPGFGYPGYGFGYNPYRPGFNPWCPTGGFNGGIEPPATGTFGRTYTGPLPNRYASSASGGKNVGGTGKTDYPNSSNTALNRPSRNSKEYVSNNSSSESTPPANRTSRLRYERTEVNRGESASRPTNSTRRPTNTASQNYSLPTRSTRPTQTEARERSVRTPRTYERPSSQSRNYTPSRTTSERNYNMNTRPSRSSSPSSNSRSYQTPTRSTPSRSTPSRSSSPSRSSNSSSRSSNTIRRR